MGGQSAPHKRGGTHRVKDADKTNSKFDDYKYAQLKDECIARKIYVKDMKKSEMARALAENERETKRAERDAAKERERKHQQQEREKQKESALRQRAYAERQRRRREKEERRKREESVSEDTPDEEELQIMKEMFGEDSDHGDHGPVGQALSDESWGSTSTETASCCTDPTILPDCKLRLFEWTYEEMPSPTARSDPGFDYAEYSRTVPMMNTYPSISNGNFEDETAMGRRVLPIPRQVPYAPIKVHTTESKEKVFLPGQTYPPGIDSDYVPLLSDHTRRAARNGILEGVLRCAAIEPATAWIDRTQIQGWNARMFFTLPPCNEDKSLPDVYQKWVLENRRLLRVKPRGDAVRGERTARHAQRYRNKGKKQAEVFEASKYRPTAVCYLPAYLDYRVDAAQLEDEIQDEVQDLENLFYIHFPGCDVPHYYFYARKGEWADPTRPNPAWDPELADDLPRRSQPAGKRLPGKSEPVLQVPIRIKRSVHLSPPASPSSPQDVPATISRIEYELYNNGLLSTIYKYRTKWRDTGKSEAWEIFGRALPLLYPSGAVPTTPPVHAEGEVSVAMKIAGIELEHAVEMFSGNEPWTSKDDLWWDIIVVDGENGKVADDHNELEEDLDELDPRDLEALYRRVSVQMSYTAMEACEKWLEDVKPEDVPLSPDSVSDSRGEWEARVFDHGRGFSHVTCPFCMQNLGYLDIQEQAEHMYRHSSLPPMRDQVDHRFPTAIHFETQFDHRVSTAMQIDSNDAYDAGAEADIEDSPQKVHAGTKTSRKRDRVTTDYLDIAQHSTSVPESGKRNRTALDFLDEYLDAVQTQKKHRAEPDSLHRKPSVPFAPQTKKRKRIVDKTYRATSFSSDSDSDNKFVPAQPSVLAKKRRKIADPTFRAAYGDTSSSEDAIAYDQIKESERKARKRRRVVGGMSRHVRRGNMEMRSKVVDLGIKREEFEMKGEDRDRYVQQTMTAAYMSSGDGSVVGVEQDMMMDWAKGTRRTVDCNDEEGHEDDEGGFVEGSSWCQVM